MFGLIVSDPSRDAARRKQAAASRLGSDTIRPNMGFLRHVWMPKAFAAGTENPAAAGPMK